jgi:hypothetical protein
MSRVTKQGRHETKMTISASEYAGMAAAAYETEKGKTPLAKIDVFTSGKHSANEYKILESTKEYIVVQKIETQEIVLAIKGTSNAGDWASNLLTGLSGLGSDPRVPVLINVVRKYKRAKANITVTGHSLGGALAAELGKMEHVMAVCFNMGSFITESLPTAALGEAARGAIPTNVINFYINGDPAPGSATLSNRYSNFSVSNKHSYNPHKLENFIGMDDTLYQEELDAKSKLNAEYRETHPNERIDDYSAVEYINRLGEDVAKIAALYAAAKAARAGLDATVRGGRVLATTIRDKCAEALSRIRTMAWCTRGRGAWPRGRRNER